jgi:hypothetical protein
MHHSAVRGGWCDASEPEVAIQSYANLVQSLGRQLAEPLDKSKARERTDLFAEHLAVSTQPPFARGNANLEREDPLDLGRNRENGDCWARVIGQIVLEDHGRSGFSKLGANGRVQFHEVYITAPDQSPSTSTCDHSASSDEEIASAR